MASIQTILETSTYDDATTEIINLSYVLEEQWVAGGLDEVAALTAVGDIQDLLVTILERDVNWWSSNDHGKTIKMQIAVDYINTKVATGFYS